MKISPTKTILQLTLSILASCAMVTAQVSNTQLCNTGLTRKSLPPVGCQASALVDPINPEFGGPIGDANWQLAKPYPITSSSAPNPCEVTLDYQPAPVNEPSVLWYNPDDQVSQWISPLGGNLTPEGWYIYRTNFLIPAAYESYRRYAFAISGQVMADNGDIGIYLKNLNGDLTTCGQIASVGGTTQFIGWNQFSGVASVVPATAGFIYVVVYNAAYVTPLQNPTGLRLEFTYSYLRPY